MSIQSVDILSAIIEEKLAEAETNGLDRDAVADRLEEHAAAVRAGYVERPEQRAEGWLDAPTDE